MGRALVFVLALAAALCIAHAADAEKALRAQARTTATAEVTEAENMYTSNAVDLEAASSENTNIDMSSSSQSNLEASADADLDLDASAAAGLGSEESMESGIGVSVDADLDMTDEEEEEDSIGADGGLSLSADLGVDLGADDISDFGKSDFDLTSIVRILQRMKYNIQQENIALAHDHRVQAKVCDDRIAAFTKQIDIWSTKVANAHKDQLTQDNIIAQLNDDIDRYDRHVNLKRQEVAKMNQELEIGKERRLAAKAVYHIKANNTLTVFRALDAIRDRLKQHIEVNGEKPTYEFKFREELQKAHVDLEDATVRSLLGNALQIFGNGAITKDDIINLHSMIALLVKDVMDYKDDLTRSEQMAVTVWLERKAQIAEQIAILTNDIDAKSRDRTLKHQRLLRVQEKIRELKEIQISLPKMMDVWAAERATVSKKCEADRTQSQMEAVSLKKQKALLLVINKVATASNELKMRLAEPITRVELPVSVVQTSRRCTKLCTSDTMQSCGVGCISNKQVCLAKKTYSCTLTVQEWAQLQLH